MEQWDATKIRAREAVHRQFARSAVYRSAPNEIVSTPVLARRHTKQNVIGDLDREGYATVMQDVNAVVLDNLEVQPVQGALIEFVADGAKFRIENVENSDDGRFVRCPVTAHER